jgi:hypothetical protein
MDLVDDDGRQPSGAVGAAYRERCAGDEQRGDGACDEGADAGCGVGCMAAALRVQVAGG